MMQYFRERKYPVYIDKNSISLYKGTPIAHPTVLIKTEILKRYQYNTAMPFGEDIELWFRLLTDGYHIDNINEPLVKFRITDNTFLRRNYKKAFYELKIYWTNLFKIHGFSLLLLYPLARFVSRLLPSVLIKKIYFSKLRIIFLKNSL
jgi:hypothetical protein